jgi:hypothetical protein
LGASPECQWKVLKYQEYGTIESIGERLWSQITPTTKTDSQLWRWPKNQESVQDHWFRLNCVRGTKTTRKEASESRNSLYSYIFNPRESVRSSSASLSREPMAQKAAKPPFSYITMAIGKLVGRPMHQLSYCIYTNVRIQKIYHPWGTFH